METYYRPSFSLDETIEQIARLEKYVGITEVPFDEDEVVFDLHNAMEYRLASAASRLMTGMRGEDEALEFKEIYREYIKLIKTVALDIAYRAYDEFGDTGKVIKAILDYLRDSKIRMVTLDYERRDEISPFEGMKRKAANGDKTRLIAAPLLQTGTTIATTLAAAQLLTNEESSFSSIDFTPTQSGAILVALAGLAIAAFRKSAPRNLGRIVGNKFHTTIKTYMLDESLRRDEDGIPFALEAQMEKYALRDLKSLIGEMSRELIDFGMQGREDIEPMIDRVLEVVQREMFQTYGINAEETWLQQSTGYFTADNLDYGLRYKNIDNR